MRVYTFPVTCDVCGGQGVGSIRTAAAAWDANSTLTHVNPQVCRAVLDQKRRELEKLADQLKERL